MKPDSIVPVRFPQPRGAPAGLVIRLIHCSDADANLMTAQAARPMSCLAARLSPSVFTPASGQEARTFQAGRRRNLHRRRARRTFKIAGICGTFQAFAKARRLPATWADLNALTRRWKIPRLRPDSRGRLWVYHQPTVGVRDDRDFLAQGSPDPERKAIKIAHSIVIKRSASSVAYLTTQGALPGSSPMHRQRRYRGGY